MPLITLVIYLIIVGLLLWLVDQLPIDGGIKRIIHILIIVIVILWLISLFLPLTGGPWIGPLRR
jgi:hypothetical protein